MLVVMHKPLTLLLWIFCHTIRMFPGNEIPSTRTLGLKKTTRHSECHWLSLPHKHLTTSENTVPNP